MKSWSLRRKISCYKNNGELIKVYDISSRLDKKKERSTSDSLCRILREITCFFLINLGYSRFIKGLKLIFGAGVVHG